MQNKLTACKLIYNILVSLPPKIIKVIILQAKIEIKTNKILQSFLKL